MKLRRPLRSKHLKEEGKPKQPRRRVIASALGALFVALSVFVTAAAPANAVVVGVCTITAQNPHPSSHVSGTINAVGTVSCSLTMDEIYIRTYLEKSGGPTWAGTPKDYFNTSYEQSNAATACSNGPGTFRTRVSYSIDAPPGVNPAYTANTIYSPWISVACGTAFAPESTGATDSVALSPMG